MINVDSVYQKVLALANKEQRGYITPQEFNLFLNQATLDIVDQYFYDLNQFSRIKGNDTGYSDMLTLLDEKIGYLTNNNHEINQNTSNASYATAILPSNLYQLGSVKIGGVVAEKITYKEFIESNTANSLTIPGGLLNGPVYWTENNDGNHAVGYSGSGSTLLHIDFVMKPAMANWGYVVVNDVALYDPYTSVNIQLHPMEESELVYKILKLAGVSSKAQDIASAGQGLENTKVQQEKI
jgi:hypothetical protein